MKSVLCVVLCSLILGQTVTADDKIFVAGLLKGKLDAVILTLQQEDLLKEEKKTRVLGVVAPIFDFSRMAKLTLGRKYWPGLQKEKQDRFSELFTRRMRQSYLEKLTLYTDEKVVQKPPLVVKERIHIPTELTSKDDRITMLYKFYRSENGWKIYDIEIQGVSIISTYRSQFDQVLRKGTIDDLLVNLEKSENK